jgi:hypothetical protein
MEHGGSDGHRQAKQRDTDRNQERASFHGGRHMLKDMVHRQIKIFNRCQPSDRHPLHSIP